MSFRVHEENEKSTVTFPLIQRMRKSQTVLKLQSCGSVWKERSKQRALGNSHGSLIASTATNRAS
ncbi:unnamed protein product [Prunus armeniaca]|uniref:Uncharacterized protein n=1 Tax=Prunus armeniaca TaxID=36596 RepID=A0A6J5WUB4_PRUAR|nr:unnamed protein product [Prunus armeniaca]